MWSMLKRFLQFRMSQKMARGTARSLGFGKLAGIVGLIAGVQAIRRHRYH
jgi:hypothetical protein